MSLIPKFEMQVRTGAKCAAIAHQSNGFAAFHTFALFLQQGTTMFVNRNQILIMLYTYQIACFGGISA